jgi:hypothetical protein
MLCAARDVLQTQPHRLGEGLETCRTVKGLFAQQGCIGTGELGMRLSLSIAPLQSCTAQADLGGQRGKHSHFDHFELPSVESDTFARKARLRVGACFSTANFLVQH